MLETVELGTAALRPRNFGGDTLVERLVLANGLANPVVEFLRAHDLYEVACWETDPIGVIRSDSSSDRPGEVVWVDITSDPLFALSPSAPDFATFMVMAGRVYEAGRGGVGLEQIFGETMLGAQQAESWRSLASMVLE